MSRQNTHQMFYFSKIDESLSEPEKLIPHITGSFTYRCHECQESC